MKLTKLERRLTRQALRTQPKFSPAARQDQLLELRISESEGQYERFRVQQAIRASECR